MKRKHHIFDIKSLWSNCILTRMDFLLRTFKAQMKYEPKAVYLSYENMEKIKKIYEEDGKRTVNIFKMEFKGLPIIESCSTEIWFF